MTPPPSDGDLWSRPDITQALAARDWAAVFKAWRQHRQASQGDLAALVGLSQPYVSAVEQGRRAITALDVVERIVGGLGISWAALGFHDPQPTGDDHENPGGEDDDVHRRDFLGLAALALPAPVAAEYGRIGDDDLDRFRTELATLDMMEDRWGGGGAYRATSSAVHHLRQVWQTASYSPRVGRDLARLVGEACNHAGWAAYDLGRADQARGWWLEGLHAADLAEDESVPVAIWATMAMIADDAGNGRDAVALADRARRSAAGLPSSRRLTSLILAREAAGHATAGNPALAWKTYARIEDDAAADNPGDDLPWMDFWGAGDMAMHRLSTARRIGDLPAAEQAARAAVTAVDATRFPRNAMSYQAALADTLVRAGQLDEALPTLGRAVIASATISSARIRRRLAGTLDRLEAHRASATVDATVEWARQYIPIQPA